MEPSREVPNSVHRVKFGDIKVIAALGDSLTAGFGAGAKKLDGLFHRYRGLVFDIGGDRSLEEHITVANVLKKFNPNIHGQSFGIDDDFPNSQFNVAVPGARAEDLVPQAYDLIKRMKNHSDMVDIEKDWKLINIFIGANDACGYCATKSSEWGAKAYGNKIRETVKVLKEGLPRTIVSVLAMLNLNILMKVDPASPFCAEAHM
uniref:Uncharacterized protein n=1 Tax=Acrobeloides nanus TaxID=290746 RepID=A0A914D2P0_9BILA